MIEDEPLPCRPGVGVKPEVLAQCRKRNREAEAEERAKASPSPPKVVRPGTVVILACSACGHRAGFRVAETFVPTRVRAAAMKLGWSVGARALHNPICPECLEVKP